MTWTTEQIDRLLMRASREGRPLYEHEAYAVIEAFGVARTPRHVFVPRAESIRSDTLAAIPSETVVLKIVAPQITHKSDVGGVVFTARTPAAVQAGVERIYASVSQVAAQPHGVLICEHVPPDSEALGHELFMGLRMTREFGPVLAAGLGGTDTEGLAQAIRPPWSSATASAVLTSAEAFLELFQRTLAYRCLSGSARGRKRLVTDDSLLNCFTGFLKMAQRYGCEGGRRASSDDPSPPTLAELEINPLVVRDGGLVALDAVCRFGPAVRARAARPLSKIGKLLEPRSMAIVGVSAKSMNLGRIILRNVRQCGFPTDRLYVIKAGDAAVDETSCVPSFAALPEKVDLAVIAVGADQTPGIIREIIAHDAAESAIVIPGGMGETESGAAIENAVKREISAAHQRPAGGPVFLGGNCMGVRSWPGRYDTFFIPPGKLRTEGSCKPRRLAFLSQSGAFLITRLSNVGQLHPTYAVTLGNQMDLTVSDFLEFLADHAQLDTYAVYVEGLADLDGLDLARAVRRVASLGKTVVVYKGGRTDAGRTAAQGHTAAIAGDYPAGAAVLHNAGALVADGFRDFEQLVELSSALHHKRVTGMKLGLVTNAGFESVGMADAVVGPAYRLEVPALSPASQTAVREALKCFRLDALVNPRNPLDLTPMAGEEAYEQFTRIMLDDEQTDAVVVSLVPLTPAMQTTADEMDAGAGIVERLAALDESSAKPLVTVIDSGSIYDPLVDALRRRGLAVVRSADQAVRSLGAYLAHRMRLQTRVVG